MNAPDTARISPTAHYTGYVWHRNGLGHRALATIPGALMFHGLRPAMAIYEKLVGQRTLETLLLRRHAVIDHLLGQAIASGRIGCVIEIAAGMSPRGVRMMRRFRHLGLRYVEGDLPGMARMKRERLEAADLLRPGHHVVTLNALSDVGQDALVEVAADYAPSDRGVAVVTEGLLNYFDREAVEGMWSRFTRTLESFPQGLYLSDLHVADETTSMPLMGAFRAALSTFARGRVHFHYPDAASACAALRSKGATHAVLHRPEAFAGTVAMPPTSDDVVRIVEAWV